MCRAIARSRDGPPRHDDLAAHRSYRALVGEESGARAATPQRTGVGAPARAQYRARRGDGCACNHCDAAPCRPARARDRHPCPATGPVTIRHLPLGSIEPASGVPGLAASAEGLADRTAESERLCGEIDVRASSSGRSRATGQLCLGAAYVKMRQTARIVSVAADVNDRGRREGLGMAIGGSEAETFWNECRRGLARRGGLQLVISDDHKGLKAAVTRVLVLLGKGAACTACVTPWSMPADRAGASRPGLRRHRLRPGRRRERHRPVAPGRRAFHRLRYHPFSTSQPHRRRARHLAQAAPDCILDPNPSPERAIALIVTRILTGS